MFSFVDHHQPDPPLSGGPSLFDEGLRRDGCEEEELGSRRDGDGSTKAIFR